MWDLVRTPEDWFSRIAANMILCMCENKARLSIYLLISGVGWVAKFSPVNRKRHNHAYAHQLTSFKLSLALMFVCFN